MPAAYTTQDIRNVALVGHAGSGKTTLAEALLKAGGAIQNAGTVEKGNTVCDYDPQEKKLRHSLDTAVVHFEARGKQVNLLDTPGYPDFIGRGISVLPAVETAILVINARAGIEPVAQRMMDAAGHRDLCRMIVVNRIDDEGADLPAILADLKETFGDQCLPLNLPADGGSRVIDCFFQPGGDDTDFSSVEEAHAALVDQVVEVDEELMELYLEQGQELQPEQLHDPFEQALREGHLIPVLFTSAVTGAGVDELMNTLARLAPHPGEGNPPPYMKGEGAAMEPIDVSPDPSKHALAHVFKVVSDPYRGKLGIFRVHQGTIRPDSQLFIGNARKAFKPSHIYRLQGNTQTEMQQAVPGDICAVAKVDEIHFDAVLHDSHDEDHHHLKTIECPVPLFGLAVTPSKRGEEQKLADALHILEAEDPCFHVEHNASANETIIRGLGELHLRVVLERLKDRFNVHVDTAPPSIAYRETISTKAEGHHRHKKQTGGAGQFGEVFLRVEPLPRGTGFEFENAVVGGAIPSQFIPAVEKGIRMQLEEGAVAGFPMQDIKVTVYDGKHHSVDSKEIAFITAGRKAFIDAVSKARPQVLEPIVNIEVIAPATAMGDLTGDLASKRGRVNGTETLSGNRIAIHGQVPLAELDGYESRLKSVTGGEGSYTLEFDHYAPVPGNVQKRLMEDFQAPEGE
jgi:elongation factor G